MSETVRVYSEYVPRKHQRKGGFFGFILKLFFLFLIIFFIWFFWTSRDLYTVERFIPTEPAFQIFSPLLMQNYPTLIQSPLWKLIEPTSSIYEVKKMLSDQPKVPVWIIKHLIYDFFYFSANDLKTFEDALFIVRLSRIGCVIEDLYSWTQPVTNDWAGGLNLKYIPEQKIYYTRKGRVLLLSPHRETLVQVTTQKGDIERQTILAKELLKNQEKHLAWGTVIPPEKNFQGLISQINFYFSLSLNQLGIKCETQIIPDTEVPWTILLSEINSSSLQEPMDSLFSCSIDTGVPIKTWLSTFKTISQTDITEPNSPPAEISFTDWIESFTPLLENQFHIAIDSFYTDEIIPFIPKYCIIAKTQPNICKSFAETVTSSTITLLGEKNKVIPSPNPDEFIVPLIGSSQTDLHIHCAEENLMFTNSTELRNRMEEYIKSNHPISGGSGGNHSLILQLKPEKLTEEINKAITVFIESNIVQFHDPKKINDLFNKIKLFKEIKIKISVNKGQLKIAGIAEFNDNSKLMVSQ